MYKNTVNKIEEIEPEKLNKLLKTDYAEEKKQTNKQNKNKNGDTICKPWQLHLSGT